MSSCCCCFGRRSRGKGHKDNRTRKPSKSVATEDLHSPLSSSSFVSEYHDAQENFGEGTSPTCTTNVTPRQSVSHEKHHDHQLHQQVHGPGPGPDLGQHALTCNGAAGPGTPPPADTSLAYPPSPQAATAAMMAAQPHGVPDHAALAMMAEAAANGALDSLHHNSNCLVGTSDTSEEPVPGGGAIAKLTGCLSILENIRMPALPSIPGVTPLAGGAATAPTGGTGAAGGAPQAGAAGGAAADAGSGTRRLGLGGKLEPGSTLRRRDMSMSALDVREAWEECAVGPGEPSTSGRPFMVRGPDYMRSKVKVPCRTALYRLLAADVISSDTKLTHVARLANLAPLLRPAADPHLPPLLILTIMLPMYPASIFGGSDGPSQSLIFYFGLPPDFNAATYENQVALELLRRFVQNGREADGSPTRDRFKLIPRVVNVDEWAQKGPLSPAEHKLLATYNDKPVLTRPQHYFFHGPGYLEVDIDIHIYQFLARKALSAYFTRLPEVVWENAFVIQGNSPEELPEQVLAAVRMYRIDMTRSRPLRDFITPVAAGAAAAPACGDAALAGKGCEELGGVSPTDSDISSLH